MSLFVTFEGGEGAGKSTQIRLLGERLRGEGYRFLETAEPGGTAIGLQIRRVLLDARNSELSPTAELLLMFAARAQNIEQSILPALKAGTIVLCDRYTDSTRAYQGVARGLGMDAVSRIEEIACRGLMPDLTFYLDIEPELGLERARARNRNGDSSNETRLDDQDIAFHRTVRQAFLDLASQEPARFRIIDAAAKQEAVASEIWKLLGPALPSV